MVQLYCGKGIVQMEIDFHHIKPNVTRLSTLAQRIAVHSGVTEPVDLQSIIQHGVDEGQLHIFPVGSGKDRRIFVSNECVSPKNMKTRPRLIRKEGKEHRRRSVVPGGQIMGDRLSPTYLRAVDYMSSMRFRPNTAILQLMDELEKEKFFDPIRNTMELLMMAEFRTYGTGSYSLPVFPDYRTRLYTDSGGIASYQGGDWHRATCDFAVSKPANSEAIHYALKLLASEYNVTEDNYRQILAAGKEAIKNPGDFGINKKPACSYRAALAIEELHETGQSAYILQQDQHASGPDLIARMTGCETLASIVRDGRFWKEAVSYVKNGNLLPEICQNFDIFQTTTAAKDVITPMLYTAGNATQMKGIILSRPTTDLVQFMDRTGCYIPGSLDKHTKDDLNPDYAHIWKSMGWERAIRVASDVARAYEKTVFALIPTLRKLMTNIKKVAKVAEDEGRYLTWENVSGCKIINRKIEENTLADMCMISITYNGKRYRSSYYPMHEVGSSSAALPNLVHSQDGGVLHLTVCWCEEREVWIATIHDSLGTHVADALMLWPVFLDNLKLVGPETNDTLMVENDLPKLGFSRLASRTKD